MGVFGSHVTGRTPGPLPAPPLKPEKSAPGTRLKGETKSREEGLAHPFTGWCLRREISAVFSGYKNLS